MIIFGVFLLRIISNRFIELKLTDITMKTKFTKLIENAYLAEKYLKTLINMAKNIDNPHNNIQFHGVSYNHLKDCEKPDCFLKRKEFYYFANYGSYFNKSDWDNKTRHFPAIFILNLYKYFLNQKGNDLVLYLSYLNYQLDEIGNYIEILMNLNNLHIESTFIQQQFSFYRISKIIDTSIKDNSIILKNHEGNNKNKRSFLNFNIILEYYRSVSELKSMLISSADQNYNFWNSFIFSNESQTVYKDGLQLFKVNTNLENLFNNILEVYENDNELIYRYSVYIKLIRGDEKLSVKYLNKSVKQFKFNDISSIEKINENKNFSFSADSAVVVASFTKERSFIEKVSESIYPLLGYTPQQVLGKELESIMPPFYRKRHASLVNFHFDTGIRRVIGNFTVLYGFHKENYIVPFRASMNLLPNLEKKLLYMAVFKKESHDYGVLLVEPHGKIDSISLKMTEFLKIDPSIFIENNIYIYHLITNYIKEYYLKPKFSFRKINIQASQLKKMEFCLDKEILEEIIKASKFFDPNTFIDRNSSNDNFISNYHKLILTKDNTNTAKGNWVQLETEIVERVYNMGINKNENTILAFHVHLETDDGDVSMNVNEYGFPKENNDAPNLEEKTDKQYFVKDLNNIEKNNKSAIKSLFLKKKAKKKDKTNEKELLKLGRTDISTTSSKLSSNFYFNYYNFRNILAKRLQQNHISMTLHIFKYCMLLILIVTSILMYFYQVEDVTNINESYVNFNTIFSNFYEYNCIDLTTNKLLMARNLNQSLYNLTYDRIILAGCLEKVYKSQNMLFQLTNNQANSKLKKQFIECSTDFNQSFIKKSGSPLFGNLTNLPVVEVEGYLVWVISSLKNKNFNVTDSWMIPMIKDNISPLLYELKTDSYLTQNFLNDFLINSSSMQNQIFLSIKLSIIFVSYIIILPILIYKKKEQLEVLESFFKIKIEDIESQRDNCKFYITSTTNIKIDNDKEDKDKEGEGLEDENNEENKIIEKVEKNEKNEKNDKNDKNPKGKHKKNKVKTFLEVGQKFSIQGFLIRTIIFILFVVMFISIFPIVSYFLQQSTYSKTEYYIQNKVYVDEFSFLLLRAYIETQNLFINQQIGRKIDSDTLKFYNQTFVNLNNQSLVFQNFQNFIITEDSQNNLNSLVNNNTCNSFNSFSLTTDFCNQFADNMTNSGLLGLSSTALYKLTQVKDNIFQNPTLNQTIINNYLNQQDFYQIDVYFRSFIYFGYRLILEIMQNYFTQMTNYYIKLLLIILCIFIALTLINFLLVWDKIEKKINSLEIDTYKLFSILPLKFVNDYKHLLDYLKKTTTT